MTQRHYTMRDNSFGNQILLWVIFLEWIRLMEHFSPCLWNNNNTDIFILDHWATELLKVLYGQVSSSALSNNPVNFIYSCETSFWTLKHLAWYQCSFYQVFLDITFFPSWENKTKQNKTNGYKVEKDRRNF